jgi:hypothetical protein
MTKVVAGRDEDGKLSRIAQSCERWAGVGTGVIAQMAGQREHFGERHAGQLVIIPEEEPGRALVVGVGQPIGCIGAVERSVDTDAPLLAGKAGGAAEESENDRGERVRIGGRHPDAVGHVHFWDSAAGSDAPGRFKDDCRGKAWILRKLVGASADHGFPGIEVLLRKIEIAEIDVGPRTQSFHESPRGAFPRGAAEVGREFVQHHLGRDCLSKGSIFGEARPNRMIAGANRGFIEIQCRAEVLAAVQHLGERKRLDGAPIVEAEFVGPTPLLIVNADAGNAGIPHLPVVVVCQAHELVVGTIVAAGLINLFGIARLADVEVGPEQD